MIICFSGRKNSGKTTLAKLLIERGFEKISFADKLKQLVSKLYNWNLKDLYNSYKKEEKLNNPVVWNKETATKLKQMIDATCDLDFKEMIFNSRREALQYIGTEILRKYDNNFHVKSIKEKIHPGKNYVLDDVRFLNELQILKTLDAVCVFIIRPYDFKNYSNHASEINIDRQIFDNIIINDGSLHKFLRKSSMFLQGVLSLQTSIISKKYLKELLVSYDYNTFNVAHQLNCSRDKIIWWATKHLIYITRNRYKHNIDVFSKPNKQSAYWAGLLSADGCIKKHLKYDMLLELSSDDIELVDGFKKFMDTDKPIYSKQRFNGKIGYTLTISCPFVIDDLKYWCIEPNKSKYNKIPDIIKNNKRLLKFWIMGLIDGDGCICIYGNNKISIRIIASKEIVEFIQKKFNFKGRIYSEKNIENLYVLCYYGQNAISFFDEIYRLGFGLNRKWIKILQFKNKNKGNNDRKKRQC